MNRRDIFKLFAGSAVIPAVKSVETLQIKADDIVILKFQERLTTNSMVHIHDTWNSKFPNIRCIVLDSGADISVLRKESV